MCSKVPVIQVPIALRTWQILAVILIHCLACSDGTTTAATTTTTGPTLGSACFSNKQCNTVTNAVCSSSICACSDGYKESAGNCLQVLDGSCSVDTDCSTYLSSTRCCNGTCTCASGHKPDNNICETVIPNDCDVSSDCYTYMANTKCDFFHFWCECANDFTYNTSSLVCVDDTTGATSSVSYETCTDSAGSTTTQSNDATDATTAGTDVSDGGTDTVLGGSCVYTSQCSGPVPNSNCIIGFCTCEEGYSESSGHCNGAQVQQSDWLIVLTSVLLVAMVIWQSSKC